MTKKILKNYMSYHEIQFIETNENFIVCPNTSLQQEYLEQWSNGMGYLPFNERTGQNVLGTTSYTLLIDKVQFYENNKNS
tara:strand:- start:462 stop:701 length:240 start_codon:yes stop_codon:yes gene_type:complete